jgi:hypothetical protein
MIEAIEELIDSIEKLLDQIKSTIERDEGFQYHRDLPFLMYLNLSYHKQKNNHRKRNYRIKE